jgi:eukaryotic-like serine/threonine-protein kinase
MKPELAVPLFLEMINVQKAALGPDDSSTLETMTRLGVVYWQQKQLDKSVPLFEEILKGQVAKNGRDHLDSFRAMANLGVNYRDAGKLKEAIPLLEEAQRAVKKHPDLEYVTGKLIEAYLMAGENDKLVNMLEERVTAMKGKLGAKDPALLDAMRDLGASYWRLRKLDKSIPLFEKVLKNREAILGRDDLQTLSDAANLGVNYRDAGRLKESIALLEEVQRASKKYPELRWVTSELVEAYKRTNDFDKAINLMQENLAEARKTLPKDSPQLAGLLAQTVLVLLEQKKWAVAEPLSRECLAIREKVQPDAWQTFNSKAQLGAALLGQKKYADAEPLLLAGYEGMKRREKTIPPPGRVRIPDALDRLIELYAATNKPDEAKKWQAERAKYPTPREVAPPPREKK